MNDILIVLVIYKKKINDIEWINDFKEINILIYDNSPVKQKNVIDSFYYINDCNNSGVSKAYNEGVKLAKTLNKKYILLLDQDTKFTLDMIEKYEKLIDKYGEEYIYTSIVGKEDKVYSPFLEKKFRGRPQNRNEFKYHEVYSLEGKSIINSGMLVPLKIIEKIGNFNEKIKLDFSDMYFIEKYKKNKKEVILVDNFLEHSISGDEGKNKKKEFIRYKFYCNGAKELYSEYRNVKTTVILRMLKLMLKYKSIKPLIIYINFFEGDDKI